MVDEDVVGRLDLIAGLLQLAHYDAIERARTRLREDEITAAILDACPTDGWCPAKTLHESVVEAVPGAKVRTVQRRTHELVIRLALRERGSTHNKAYRATGLV